MERRCGVLSHTSIILPAARYVNIFLNFWRTFIKIFVRFLAFLSYYNLLELFITFALKWTLKNLDFAPNQRPYLIFK